MQNDILPQGFTEHALGCEKSLWKVFKQDFLWFVTSHYGSSQICSNGQRWCYISVYICSLEWGRAAISATVHRQEGCYFWGDGRGLVEMSISAFIVIILITITIISGRGNVVKQLNRLISHILTLPFLKHLHRDLFFIFSLLIYF